MGRKIKKKNNALVGFFDADKIKTPFTLGERDQEAQTPSKKKATKKRKETQKKTLDGKTDNLVSFDNRIIPKNDSIAMKNDAPKLDDEYILSNPFLCEETSDWFLKEKYEDYFDEQGDLESSNYDFWECQENSLI